MFKKGTKIYSVANGKCPRCHEGDFFKYKFTIHPSKITQLHDNCPECNLRYMIEPSFFFGAMYVNYGLTVAISIATFLIATLLFSLTLLQSFAAIIVALLALTPLNLRLSRIIWINMFVSYSKNSEKQNEKK
ncbi:DUF983 domain-containing protein [Polaribacter sp. IC073]|uniref:DUF983 domain-containing protein n=1 Tax=Polaribacter sp. IC073 TaxID=2508540 RepID=UPI0011BFD6FF|nr:DUF983 domain-containing protein [Polaribacter sp. IC073]TXD47606.1 DUF983 domain-containing protein [Polaribacter sp. IC073]